jgi:thioredoxin reductase (NADPH)
LYAIGRDADTSKLGLETAGVTVDATGKVITNDAEQTSVANIYAIGDMAANRPELTPVAIRAGEYLARRLVKGSSELLPYQFVPTTVFTPVEYGCVGLSEEAAIGLYGQDNIETYLFEFNSLEMSVAERHKVESRQTDELDVYFAPSNLSKLVCLKTENERVVGFHFVGPNAGEITQGFALAVKLGATKSDFDKLIGIHPTDAESFVSMDITRASGKSWVAAGGCGGGKCG